VQAHIYQSICIDSYLPFYFNKLTALPPMEGQVFDSWIASQEFCLLSSSLLWLFPALSRIQFSFLKYC
jgi:hypothetical protein